MAEHNQRPMEGEVLSERESRALQLANDGSLIGGMLRVEIDIQYDFAMRNPRSPARIKRAIETYATLDTETAEDCFFRKPQRMKDEETGRWINGFIEGPSIRFAEIAYNAWTNCRCVARRTDITDVDIEATAIFHDLESNTALAMSVRRSIMTSDKDGKNATRFPQHLITLTENAAAAIARRNVILACVPRGLWKPGYKMALAAAKGTADTLGIRRENLLKRFAEEKVDARAVYEVLGIRGVDDLSLDVMFDAAGILTGIRDGEVTLEQLLADVRGSRPAPSLDEAFGKASTGKGRGPSAAKPKEPAEQKDAAEVKTSPPSEDTKSDSQISTDRPTETASARPAEQKPASSEPGTVATGDSQAASPGPSDTAPPSDDGGDDDADAEGLAGVSEAQDRIDAETRSQGQDESLSEATIAAFNAYADGVKKTSSWLQIKPLLKDFRATNACRKAPEGAQVGALTMAYDRAVEIRDSVKPGADILFFECWLYRGPTHEIDDVWSALIRSKDYEKAGDAEQERVAMLMEAQKS